MRKLFVALAFAGALALSGCSTGTETHSFDEVAQQVLGKVQEVCGKLPKLQSVIEILKTIPDPRVMTVSTIVNEASQAICTAITTKGAVETFGVSKDTEQKGAPDCPNGSVNGVCVEVEGDVTKGEPKGSPDCPHGSVNGVCVEIQ